MKTTIKILAIVLYFLASINTELSAQNDNTFGIRSGIGIYNQYWGLKGSMEEFSAWQIPEPGFMGFVFYEFNVTNGFKIRSEVGYLNKKYSWQLSDIINGHVIEHPKFSMSTNHLSLGFLGKYQFLNSKKLSPYILVGGHANYLLGDTYKGFQGVFLYPDGTIGFTEKFKNYNSFYGDLDVGIGMEYNQLVFLEFNYNYTFTTLFETDHTSIKDQFYNISIGLNLNPLFK